MHAFKLSRGKFAMVRFSSVRVIAVSIFIMFNITGNKSASLKNLEAGVTFGQLLTSIAKLNDEKMNTLKRYTGLDNYSLSNRILTQAEELKKDPIVAIIVLNDYSAQANDGLLYKDDYSRVAPTYNPVKGIFHPMKGVYDYEFEDSAEAKQFKIRSIIENLNNYAMRKNLDVPKYDVETNTFLPISSVNNPMVPPRNFGNKMDKYKFPPRNVGNKMDLYKFPPTNVGNNMDIYKFPPTNIGNKLGTYQLPPTNVGNEIDIYEINKGEKEIDDHKQELQMSPSHSSVNVKTKDILRIFKKCSKKAMKVCVKACKSAYKKVCKEYKCSKSMKTSFKKHCKSECEEQFEEE